MLVQLCERVANDPGPPFLERVSGLRGRKRPYFSTSAEKLRDPIQIPGLTLYVEGNISANSAERLARRTLQSVRGSDEGFRIEIEGEGAAATEPTSSRMTTSRTGILPSAENFIGLRPAAFWFDGERYEVTKWNGILQWMCEHMAKEAGATFGQQVAQVRGTSRKYFSEDADELDYPLRLTNASLYLEGKFNANDCVRVARQGAHRRARLR